MQSPGVRFVTLRQAWLDYKAIRKLKPETIRVYESCLERCVVDWLDLPIEEISKSMIEDRHTLLSTTLNKWGQGEAQANLCMRVMRALFTFAGHKYDIDVLLVKNPVKWLSTVRAWNSVPRRENVIRPDQMKDWFDGLMTIEFEVVRDFLVTLLLTGLRRNEASRLLWDDVNLKATTLTVRDPKNARATGSNTHTIPLSFPLAELFWYRYHRRTGPFVFPGGRGRNNKSLSPWNQTHKEITAATGIEFCPHDLRRTFITTADGLDIDNKFIKALVNHKTADITERYIIRSPEKLRPYAQRINDEILHQAELTDLRRLWEN